MRAGWGWGVVLSVLVYRSSATSLRYTLDLFLIHMRPTTCLCSSLVFQVLKIENLQVYHQRKRPSDALTEEKTKERKKKYDQETRKRSFQESWEKIVNGWFSMKKKHHAFPVVYGLCCRFWQKVSICCRLLIFQIWLYSRTPKKLYM